jgi:L-aminopeptidase/D-esterase-like protein
METPRSQETSLTLTAVDGILVGHATDERHRTGCTAILCPEGATPGAHVCGFAPGTREVALCDPLNRADQVQGVLLSGGSAFGLDAASGVVRWLTERDRGLPTLYGRVPLVPSAIIYDLNFNQSRGLPDAAMGYQAAQNASAEPVPQGCVGAGTGATCGKMAGFDRAMKSGLGSAGVFWRDVQVAALAVVNPLGSVLDADTGRIIAGGRTADGRALASLHEVLSVFTDMMALSYLASTNTVLGVVATNARLSKIQAARVARMAAAGIAQTIRPAHTLFDGDVVFCLATGRGPAGEENLIGALGAEMMARAVVNGAMHAHGVPEYPAARDL